MAKKRKFDNSDARPVGVRVINHKGPALLPGEPIIPPGVEVQRGPSPPKLDGTVKRLSNW